MYGKLKYELKDQKDLVQDLVHYGFSDGSLLTLSVCWSPESTSTLDNKNRSPVWFIVVRLLFYSNFKSCGGLLIIWLCWLTYKSHQVVIIPNFMIQWCYFHVVYVLYLRSWHVSGTSNNKKSLQLISGMQFQFPLILVPLFPFLSNNISSILMVLSRGRPELLFQSSSPSPLHR